MASAMRKIGSSRRVLAVALAVMMSTSLLPIAASAQSGQEGIVAKTQSPSGQPSSQDQNAITRPIAQSPDVPPDRVGVTLGQNQTLTMQDAIAMALKNNLDIESFRQGVQIAERNLYSLRGVYDVLTGGDVNFRSQTTPVANLFAGGGAQGSFKQEGVTWNFSADQFVEKGGGAWSIDFTNNRFVTDSTASTLPTQFNTGLNFTYSQPLMRNFKIDQNRRLIQVAKKSLDLSDSQFRQMVIETINNVQRAYWDLVFAIRNEQIAREAVELSKTQLDNNRKMVTAGTLAPIELRSNEAQLEQNKGDVISALQQITTAENVLKGLLLKDTADPIWSSAIVPTEQPIATKSAVNLDESQRLALKNRPELDQLRLQVEQKEIDLKFFRNQLKPQVDFIGIFASNGLAGTPATAQFSPGGFDPLTQGLLTNLNSALNALSLPAFNPPVPGRQQTTPQVGERFDGGFGTALHNLFSGDFTTYQFGVRFSFPIRNRTAEGNLGRTEAEFRQLDARQRQLVQSVQIDVRNALQAVEAARMRFEAAQAASLAADAQLKGEQEKFRAGLSTNFVVLQRQTDYSTAKGNEVRALTDYNKALADLQRVTGMTLLSNNVQVNARAGGGK